MMNFQPIRLLENDVIYQNNQSDCLKVRHPLCLQNNSPVGIRQKCFVQKFFGLFKKFLALTSLSKSDKHTVRNKGILVGKLS